MARPVRDPSGITTRDRIAAAAMALFEAHGFDAVTVDDIAARAGVTQRTVFRHFTTKAAMVLDPVRFCYFVVLPSAAPTLHDAVRAALAGLAGRIEEKRETVVRHIDLFGSSVALRTAARGVAEEALQALRRDLAHYLRDAETSTRVHVLAEMIYAIAFGARRRWFEDREVAIAAVLDESFAAAAAFFHPVPEPA